MNKTVFISSTYEDLKEYRRAIWDLLEKFNVNVRGMEDFGARKEAALTTCIAEVEQSDIYLGVIAFRLGSVDPQSGRSFTQIEYEKAYSLGKEILIYLVDEQNALFRYRHIDQDDKGTKLEVLKTLFRERHTTESFTSADDLKEKLQRDLKRLLTQKSSPESNHDEYVISKQIIDRFFLTPKQYSGKEIPVTVQFKSPPFPASKKFCTAFNLEFGETVGRAIEIIRPEGYKNSGLDESYGTSKHAEIILTTLNKVSLDIYVKLLFADEALPQVRARYRSETFYEPPDYDQYDNYEVHYSADAKLIFMFSKLAESI